MGEISTFNDSNGKNLEVRYGEFGIEFKMQGDTKWTVIEDIDDIAFPITDDMCSAPITNVYELIEVVDF